MTKEEVQQRVLCNGKPISLDEFTWDDKTNTFSSVQNFLVLDFNFIDYIIFKTSSDCTFKTGPNCTFDTGPNCTFKTGSYCTFKTGSSCTFKTGSGCTFNTFFYCTFKTMSSCTFDTGSDCTFDTGSSCTFDTGPTCTFKTGYFCTFKTGSSCTFKTGSSCTFDAGYSCTFDIGYGCTFKTGENSVIIRRDDFSVITCDRNFEIKFLPVGISGYIVKYQNEDFFHRPNEKEQIEIIDGIVSTVISKKGNVLKVINHGESDESYIVTDGDRSAHGKTIKEAKESLIYKISNKDTSKYESFNLETELTFEEGVQMYRAITGSCESQTKNFAEQHKFEGKKTIAEIIEITKGQFNNDLLTKFFTQP